MATRHNPYKRVARASSGTPYKDQLPGGLGDEKAPSDFDQDQLKKGVKVELEHTDDPLTALEISVDHLTENPQYYDLLETIEGPGAHDSESGFGPGQGKGRGLGPGGGDPSKCPFRAASDSDHTDEIVRLLRENPEPDDAKIHQLATKLGLEPSELEEEVYRILARLLAVKKKGDDKRVFIEGDDPADLLAELALSLYERGDDVLGDAVADVYAAWR